MTQFLANLTIWLFNIAMENPPKKGGINYESQPIFANEVSIGGVGGEVAQVHQNLDIGW